MSNAKTLCMMHAKYLKIAFSLFVCIAAIFCHAQDWPGKLTKVNGVTMLSIDGKNMFPTAMRWANESDGLTRAAFQKSHSPFFWCREAGVPVILLGIMNEWTGPDRYDYSELDATVEKILLDHPQAYIIFGVYLEYAKWYPHAHPETNFMVNDGGKVVGLRGSIIASFNSSKFEADAKKNLSKLVEHLKEKGYSKRTIGFMINYGATAEWRYWDQKYQRPDWNPESIEAWQKYLRKKYGDTAQLNKKWKSNYTEFKEILPPDGSIGGVFDAGYLCDPNKDIRIGDYYNFTAESIRNLRKTFASYMKKLTQNRAIIGTYTTGFVDDQSADGVIDFVVSSSFYPDRAASGVSLPQPLNLEAMRQSGVHYWHDADMRTYFWLTEKFGVGRNMYESIMLMRREFLYPFINGAGTIWVALNNDCNIYGNMELMRTIAELESISNAALQMNYDMSSAAKIAVVAPKHSRTACWWNAPRWPVFVRSGAAVDFFNDNEIELIDPERYKMVVLACIPDVSESGRKHLEKFKSGNRTLLFLYGAGLVTENGFSVEAAGKLTGFDFELLPGADYMEFTEPGFVKYFGRSRQALGKETIPNGALRMLVKPKKGDEVILRAKDGKPLFVRHRYPDWQAFYHYNYLLHNDVFQKILRLSGIKLNFGYDSVYYHHNKYFHLISSTEGVKKLYVGNAECVLDVFNDRLLPVKNGNVTLNIAQYETLLLLADSADRVEKFRKLVKENMAARKVTAPERKNSLKIVPGDSPLYLAAGAGRGVTLAISSVQKAPKVSLEFELPEGVKVSGIPGYISLQNGEEKRLHLSFSAAKEGISGKVRVTMRHGKKVLAATEFAVKTENFHYLSDIDCRKGTTGWGEIKRDKSCDGKSMKIGKKFFDKGIGVHAPSSLKYDLRKGSWGRLTGYAGVSSYLNPANNYASCQMKIVADGKEIFQTGKLKAKDEPVYFDLDLTGVKSLEFITGNAGDGMTGDHGNWGEVKLHPAK